MVVPFPCKVQALARLTQSALRTGQFARHFASQADFDDAQKRLFDLKSEPAGNDKLKVYGLFKQATIGDVEGDQPDMMNFVARAKWDAWSDYKGLSKEDARQQYIDLVTQLEESQE